MKTKLMIGLALCFVVAPLSLGCATQPNRGTAQNSYTQGVGSDELDEVIGDRWLHSQLVLDEVLTRRVDDRLQVQFNLRNASNRNLSIEWTLVWFDGSGFELQSSRDWSPAVIGGKGYQSIHATAPSVAAMGFRLGLRKPNTVH